MIEFKFLMIGLILGLILGLVFVYLANGAEVLPFHLPLVCG